MKKLLAPIFIAAIVFFAGGVGNAEAVCRWTLSQNRSGEMCFASTGEDSCTEFNNELTFTVTGIQDDGQPYDGRLEVWTYQDGSGWDENDLTFLYTSSPGELTFTHHPSIHNRTITSADFRYEIRRPRRSDDGIGLLPVRIRNCAIEIRMVNSCPDENSCAEETTIDSIPADAPFHLCEQIPENREERMECEECAGRYGNQGVWTAIGCIDRDPSTILQVLLYVGITIAGGVALLMILAAGFIFSTSSGDPKKIEQAKELITSAVVGLIFIIFSVAILQFIGVTVLRIPGFGG